MPMMIHCQPPPCTRTEAASCCNWEAGLRLRLTCFSPLVWIHAIKSQGILSEFQYREFRRAASAASSGM